ncbi:Transcription initiation factor TFIID subunit 1 [Morella rubra]|uniref:Transcription initiation factor TFIID subunit 1 n=1 Tax=Morella rubra TaxID=262757 RepID=A0A6A1VE82_9ROSI|nr:Transcription initiation factor TFIID subunit 1 [Morella rubra]
MAYESGCPSQDGRDEDDEEEYEEAGGSNRFLGFMFGNVDNSGDLDVDYLDEDAKEHLAALVDKLGPSLTDIDLSVKSPRTPADAAEQDYDEKAEDAVDYEDIDEQYEGPEIQATTEEDHLLPKMEYFSAEVPLAALKPTSIFDDENYDEELELEHEIVDNNVQIQTLSGELGESSAVVSKGEKSLEGDLEVGSPEAENVVVDEEEDQNTPGGKYDGLRPGALNAETRHLLGLGELDPPPWLHRMREIGYPPGYLDPDDEDQPSGITIYADGENKEEQEDGEIIETDYPEPQRKMTVQFPGVNAPIPENADERLWAAGPSSLDLSRNRMHRRLNHYSEPVSRGNHREQRWSRDFPDDGPPGCEPGYSSSLSSYLPRYSDYDSGYDSYSPRSNISRPRSPPFGRSMSDRGKRSPLFDEGPLNDPLRRDYGSGRYENRTDEARNDYGRDFSSHSKDTQDRHYYRSRR